MCQRASTVFESNVPVMAETHLDFCFSHYTRSYTLSYVILLLVIYNHHYGMWMLRKTGASVMRPICMHGACVALLAPQFKMQIGSHKALRVN